MISGELKETEDRLERKNEQLERLAQVVSHDLQTPLSTAEKLLGLLRADIDTTDPAVEQSLDDLDTTLRRLQEFADNLPRLARESTDVEQPVACDLAEVARAAWCVVDTDQLSLQIESTRQLTADPKRLQQVFENLYQNTVTHGVSSDTDSATTVRIGSCPDGFYIEDDGPGIQRPQRGEIFEYGVSTGEGSGFGLAIVRTIIHAHGWQIDVTDGSTGGARFEITTGDGVD